MKLSLREILPDTELINAKIVFKEFNLLNQIFESSSTRSPNKLIANKRSEDSEKRREQISLIILITKTSKINSARIIKRRNDVDSNKIFTKSSE